MPIPVHVTSGWAPSGLADPDPAGVCPDGTEPRLPLVFAGLNRSRTLRELASRPALAPSLAHRTEGRGATVVDHAT